MAWPSVLTTLQAPLQSQELHPTDWEPPVLGQNHQTPICRILKQIHFTVNPFWALTIYCVHRFYGQKAKYRELLAVCIIINLEVALTLMEKKMLCHSGL